MDRDAIVRELQAVGDPVYVYGSNLAAAERFLDALSGTLEELAAADGEEEVRELGHEVREHLVRLASACMDYLIFSGLSFVAAWEQLAGEGTGRGSTRAGDDGGRTAEEWYLILKSLHGKAVRQHVHEPAPSAGGPPTPDTFFVRMVRLGAAAVAALEGLDESSPYRRISR